MTVSAIVPALNEAERIAATVTGLLALEPVTEVLVVDDGSDDDTAARAEAAGARVLRSSRNRGKGAAVAAGIARAGGTILLLIDADVSDAGRVARALLEPVRDGTADMTIAAPPPGGPSGFGLVERFARVAIRRLTGQTFARPLSGQRCLRRSAVEGARLPAGFGFEVALTIHALRTGCRVREIEVPVEHRRTGRDLRGFVHRGRQGLAVAREVAARGVRFPR